MNALKKSAALISVVVLMTGSAYASQGVEEIDPNHGLKAEDYGQSFSEEGGPGTPPIDKGSITGGANLGSDVELKPQDKIELGDSKLPQSITEHNKGSSSNVKIDLTKEGESSSGSGVIVNGGSGSSNPGSGSSNVNSGYLLDTMIDEGGPISIQDELDAADKEKENDFKMTLGEIQNVSADEFLNVQEVDVLQKNLYEQMDFNIQDKDRVKINPDTLVDGDSKIGRLNSLYFISKRDIQTPWYFPILICMPFILILSFIPTCKEFYKERLSAYIDELN